MSARGTRASSWPSSARPACSARSSAASSPARTRCSASPAGAGSSTSTCRSASLAFAVVVRVLHLPHTRREHRIDWPGALALITSLVPLLIVAEQGRTWGWDSGRALLCYAIGVVGLDRVHPRRAGLQGRRAAPAAPVQEPQLRGRQRRQHRAGRRHVRRHPAAAAVPADRARLQPDGRRPADDPAGRRHHDRRHGLRHRDQQDRQVQDLPAGRHRVHRRRAGLDVVHHRRRHLGVDPGAVHGPAGPRASGFNFQPVILAVQNAVSPAGDGRRDVVGHVLPPDGRHDRGRGLPVDPVHHAAGQDQQRADRGRGHRPAGRPALQSGQLQGGGDLSDTSFIQKLPDFLATPFKTGFSDSIDLVFLVAAAVVAIGFFVMLFLPRARRSATSRASRPSRTGRRRDQRHRRPRRPTRPRAGDAAGGRRLRPPHVDRPAGRRHRRTASRR